MCVDVEIVRRKSVGWRIVGDVTKLIVIVQQIPDTMLMIAAMPYFFLCDFPGRKGISAFDELNTFRKRLIVSRREEQMNMVWHNCETMQVEFALVSISVERLEEELSVRFFFEVTKLHECRNGYGVGARLCGHGRKHTSGLKPLLISRYETQV
jgi:hypothetical protein